MRLGTHKGEGRRVVSPADALIKVVGQAADNLALADIRPAEAAAHHAADVTAGLEQRHPHPLPRRRHGRRHAPGGRAVDDDIVGLRRLHSGLEPETEVTFAYRAADMAEACGAPA